MKTLSTLIAKANQARKDVDTKLLAEWPPGTEVQFKIMSGQKNLSSGTVVGAGYDMGYLRVRHNQAKPYSRYWHRNIHYSSIA